ncbi:TolC family protein [bacterium]|nr:TolC family protein [bacterium]
MTGWNKNKKYWFIFAIILISLPVCSSEDTSLDLDLVKAVQMTLERSYDFKNDSLDVEISESIYRVTQAAYNPLFSLSTDSTYTKPGSSDVLDTTIDHQINAGISKQFTTTGGKVSIYSNLTKYDDTSMNSLNVSEGNNGQYSNVWGISLDQPLLKNIGPWSDRLAMEQSRLSLEDTRNNFALSRRKLILDVINLYFVALKQEKLVDVGIKSVETAQLHLDNTRVKLEEGLVAMMDVSQAELQFARQKTSLIRTRQFAAASMDNLKIKLNLSLNTVLNLTEIVENLAEPLDSTLLVPEALYQRLEIQLIQNQIRSTEMSVTMAMNQRLPALNFVMNAELTNQNNDVSEVFHVENEDYNVSMGLSWTIGSRIERENWLQERIRLKKLQNQLAQKRLFIEKEVLDEVRNYQALVEALKVSEKSVEVAERALELASQSYQEGLASNLDLIKAQDDLFDARNGYLSELMDLAVSKIRILNVVGREINPQLLVLKNEEEV